MPESPQSFREEIEANKSAERVSVETASLETGASSLEVRLRGGFITGCELTSPTSGKRINIFFSDQKIEEPKPKISATHDMMPAGPSKDIGGQHGFPRWADYHQFEAYDGPNGEKRISLQAKRSDYGLSLAKTFELAESSLTTHSMTYNSDEETANTSMGNHQYFRLEGEKFDGLKVDGHTLDDLAGEGAEERVKNGETLFLRFDGEKIIDFPEGYSIKLSAEFTGESESPMALWVWHKPGSDSICFEPVIGVSLDNSERDGVKLKSKTGADLSTRVELL